MSTLALHPHGEPETERWSEVIRILVPWDLGRTSPNRSGRLSAQMATKREARLAGYRAWEAAGRPRLRCRVRVHLMVFRARAMDLANLWAAAKQVVDGCFVGLEHWHEGKRLRVDPAMLPDDSEAYFVPGTVSQEIEPQHKGRESLLFVVEAQGAVGSVLPLGVFSDAQAGRIHAESEAGLRGHELAPWTVNGWHATTCGRCGANLIVREAGRTWEVRGWAVRAICSERVGTSVEEVR